MNNFLLRICLEDTLFAAWRNQVPRIRWTLLISFAVALGGIIAVYALSQFVGVPPSWLTRDAADITDSRSYLGMLSTLGIWGWVAATTICLWAALLLRHEDRSHKSALFLLISGFLSLLLAFDDAFMLHERVLPRLQIPESAMFLGYLLIIVGYGSYFLRQILKTEYLLLILAAFFLGLSATMDQIIPFSESEAFLEDCPKFLGIVLWLAYFSRTASVMVKEGFAWMSVSGPNCSTKAWRTNANR